MHPNNGTFTIGASFTGAEGDADPGVTFNDIYSYPEARYPTGNEKKDQREDSQLFSALNAITSFDNALSPIEVRRGGDPPDRIINLNGTEWATELTILTHQDLKQEIDQMRKIATKLQGYLREHSEKYPHLIGRRIAIDLTADGELPKAKLMNIEVEKIKEALLVDKGYWGQGSNFDNGLPEKIHNTGTYYESRFLYVGVQTNPGSDQITVDGGKPMQIKTSEVIRALNARIEEKDTSTNELLIINFGCPDDHGYICSADTFMFNLLLKAQSEGNKLLTYVPKYLDCVILHRWNSKDFIITGSGVMAGDKKIVKTQKKWVQKADDNL